MKTPVLFGVREVDCPWKRSKALRAGDICSNFTQCPEIEAGVVYGAPCMIQLSLAGTLGN